MSEARVNYSDLLGRLKARTLTDHDYEVLVTELEKLLALTKGGSVTAEGKRIVAELPFGLDIVK